MRKLALLMFTGLCCASAAQSSTGQAVVGQSVSAQSSEQVEMLGNAIPHPYFFFGPSSSVGEGYARVVGRAEGGIDMESAHAIFRALGAYDTGTKINDNDQPNPNGHDRYLEGAAYYRAARGMVCGLVCGRWFAMEPAFHHRLFQGRDSSRDWRRIRPDAARLQRVPARLLHAGESGLGAGRTDWQNGSHGAAVSVTLPTPREKRHWFLRNCLSAYGFHTTVTEPQNLALTRAQRAQQGFAGGDEMGVVYRF